MLLHSWAGVAAAAVEAQEAAAAMWNQTSASSSSSTGKLRRGGGRGGPLKKGPWTAAENAILVSYVKQHGVGDWNNVQKRSGLSRCGKSCRLRWANHLRPDLKKGPITEEEGRKIVELHAQLGNKWARMAAQLPGRTDNEIKNFWNTRKKRMDRLGGSKSSSASASSSSSSASSPSSSSPPFHHSQISSACAIAMSPADPLPYKTGSFFLGMDCYPKSYPSAPPYDPDPHVFKSVFNSLYGGHGCLFESNETVSNLKLELPSVQVVSDPPSFLSLPNPTSTQDDIFASPNGGYLLEAILQHTVIPTVPSFDIDNQLYALAYKNAETPFSVLHQGAEFGLKQQQQQQQQQQLASKAMKTEMITAPDHLLDRSWAQSIEELSEGFNSIMELCNAATNVAEGSQVTGSYVNSLEAMLSSAQEPPLDQGAGPLWESYSFPVWSYMPSVG